MSPDNERIFSNGPVALCSNRFALTKQKRTAESVRTIGLLRFGDRDILRSVKILIIISRFPRIYTLIHQTVKKRIVNDIFGALELVVN